MRHLLITLIVLFFVLPAHALEKNVASQKWVVFCFDEADGTVKTGDAAQITANLRIDGGGANAVDDTNPTELEDGYYIFDITAAESNGDLIVICPASSTADVQCKGEPSATWTVAPNSNALGIESDGDVTKVNTLDGHTAQTGDSYAIVNGDHGLVSIQDDIDAILVDTGTTLQGELDGIQADTEDLQAQIGTDGAGLTNVTWNASWDAEVQSEATDALNAYDPPTAAELTTAVGDVSVDEIQASALADLFNTDSGTDYASAVAGSVVKETADNAGGSALTESGIADAVWDEAISGHAVAGSTGEALSNASSAGDPWSTSLPGAYGGGTAGYLIGTYVNAPIGTVDTVVDAIKAKTDNLPDDPADDSDIDSQLSAIAGYVDTEVAAILADTDEMQTDDIPSTLATVDGKIDTVDGIVDDILVDTGTTLDDFIDTEIAVIKAKTDNLPVDPADDSDIDSQLSNITGKVDTAQADLDIITGAAGVVIADDSITAAKLATDSITSDELSAAAVDEIWAEVLTELSAGAPDATPAVRDAVMLMYMHLRNKTETTSAEHRITNNAGTVITESDISDDGTTFNKGEYGPVD